MSSFVQELIEEQILQKPLKLTIKRKEKQDVVMYFDTVDSVKIFKEFIEELIESVKRRS